MRHKYPNIQLLIEYLYGLLVMSGCALQSHTNEAAPALSIGSVHFANASFSTGVGKSHSARQAGPIFQNQTQVGQSIRLERV